MNASRVRARHAGADLRTFADVVKHYRATYARSCGSESAWIGKLDSLTEATRCAALAINENGKRSNHQRRIPGRVLRKSEQTLQGMRAALRSCRTFDELFELVDAEIGDIDGIGELTVYDTATRLGAYLRLAPRYIYLHAGTRVGAKALGFTGKERRIAKSELPAPLRVLSASQLEDLLCIYKTDLARLSRLAR